MDGRHAQLLLHNAFVGNGINFKIFWRQKITHSIALLRHFVGFSETNAYVHRHPKRSSALEPQHSNSPHSLDDLQARHMSSSNNILDRIQVRAFRWPINYFEILTRDKSHHGGGSVNRRVVMHKNSGLSIITETCHSWDDMGSKYLYIFCCIELSFNMNNRRDWTINANCNPNNASTLIICIHIMTIIPCILWTPNFTAPRNISRKSCFVTEYY